ncbi:dihydrolipoyl dehydrogenase [bacterium]|nr:dihydrolipoyl dehydrogenase [bacterium]
MEKYQVAIIGGGPGGATAAEHAKKNGLKTVLIEKEHLGGTCLNIGCMPTKAMIACGKVLEKTRRASEFGLKLDGEISADINAIVERKNNIVQTLCKGLQQYFKQIKIDIKYCEAKFLDSHRIQVGDEEIEAEKIIIATGSVWSELPNIKVDREYILSSTEMLNIKELPEHLLIIGGGVIGCEFASLFNQLGSKVTIVEATKNLLPQVDLSVSKYLHRVYKKKQISVHLDTMVESTKVSGRNVEVKLNNGETILASKVLVAVGRKPNLDGFGLENVGLEVENGAIKVNEYLQSSIPHIYAIGDVKGGLMLAHLADYDGEVVVENILGKNIKTDYSVIPSPIFTCPEMLVVGMTESEIQEKGLEYKTAKVPFRANGKAHCDGELEGQIALYVDTNKYILGAHIIGEEATSMGAEFALAMKNKLTIDAISKTVHAHPTLSELAREAVMSIV